MNPVAENLMSGTEVPRHYRGIWRRSLLETAGETAEIRDTSTTVFWLQAASWHADIRIPSGRPDFTGITSLAGCKDIHLEWLSTQQGFAGITRVRKDDCGEICRWQRIIDYQPPQATPDEGRMQFEPTRLVETGVHARYLEHWHLVEHTSVNMAVLQTVDTANRARTKEMLFLAGQYVMHLIWPGTLDWPGLGQEAKTPGARRDLEISFGKRTARGYAIVCSTMPWLEGRERMMQVIAREGCRVALSCDGSRRTWQFLELPTLNDENECPVEGA